MTDTGENNRLIVLRRKLQSGYKEYLDQQQQTLHGSSAWSYLEGRCDSYTVAIDLMDELYPETKELMDNHNI